MKIVIIEDEIRTAKLLASTILQIRPDVQIMASLQTVNAAVAFFQGKPAVDLIFMDILLSDGHCFDIFDEIEIRQPIIFCTAYDDYMLPAFRKSGIDYVLKPINKDSIANALEKWETLQKHFLLSGDENSHPKSIPYETRKGFLVFEQNRYRSLPFNDIAYFFVVGGEPAIRTFENKTIFVDQPLTKIIESLPETEFYRVNRQYIINRAAIKEVEPYYLRKLDILLGVPVPSKLLINKNKRTEFLKWFGAD